MLTTQQIAAYNALRAAGHRAQYACAVAKHPRTNAQGVAAQCRQASYSAGYACNTRQARTVAVQLAYAYVWQDLDIGMPATRALWHACYQAARSV